MLPPSSRLPPIRTIGSENHEDLHDTITYIRTIYNPPVRGTRRASDHSTENEESRDLEAFRTDSFERAYVIKWLTALVSYFSSCEEQDAEPLIRDSSALLAICAGTASAGVITRTFLFASPSGQVSVLLRDVPLDNRDYGSVGAQTWGGACIMAEMIAEQPERFGITPQTSRVLELGAGTGLVSLVVGKLAQQMHRDGIGIVATDYYPSVLENLKVNIDSNKFAGVRVVDHPLDWSLFPTSPPQRSPLDQPFDVVFGADIVYEQQHAVWIKSCLANLLRKPSPSHDPIFHLIIPLRSTHTFESNTIETVFADNGEGSILVIKSKETVTCIAERGKERDEEVEYAYYKIGWR